MEAAINLVTYLYYSKNLFIQYTRGSKGNDPELFEKEWSHRKSIEERLRASKPESAPDSPDLYIDADYAGDPNTRRSTSGMVDDERWTYFLVQPPSETLCAVERRI